MAPWQIRWSGLAAIVGGVLIAILTLLETYSFHGGIGVRWMIIASSMVVSQGVCKSG